MSWVKNDDRKPLNRKIRHLSDAAYRLDDQALHHCARELTDGLIWLRDLEEVVLGIKGRRVSEYIRELVDAGLWHPTGATCPSEYCPAHYEATPDGAWIKHDYWEYQPTREEELAKRARRADAGRLGGIRSGASRRSKPQANSEANASILLKQEGSKNEPRPVPSRPVPVTEVHLEDPPVLGPPSGVALELHAKAKRLCEEHSDRVALYAKRPAITSASVHQAISLLEMDGRSFEEALDLIDWSTQDDFWRSNVLSLRKFREHYDQLRLRRQEATAKRPGVLPTPTTDDPDAIVVVLS